jgi:hypothetical protein
MPFFFLSFFVASGCLALLDGDESEVQATKIYLRLASGLHEAMMDTDWQLDFCLQLFQTGI